jgi:sterol desaturase/sphingolipid hydroxylase (fatty acid hydroxylase superfamily)
LLATIGAFGYAHRLISRPIILRLGQIALVGSLIALPILQRQEQWARTLVVLACIVIELFVPRVERSFFDKSTELDLLHAVAKRMATILTMVLVLRLTHGRLTAPWGLNVWKVPFLVQSLAALTFTDLAQYWLHRFQHKFDVWWKFHQIHHSTTRLNWLANERNHPLDWAVQVMVATAVVGALGIDYRAFVAMLPFRTFVGIFTHSNVNFPRDGLSWWSRIIATPHTHALHHVAAEGESTTYNYGSTFILWDRLFGTFRETRPDPAQFGLNDPSFPEDSFLAQQLLPFRRRAPASAPLSAVVVPDRA